MRVSSSLRTASVMLLFSLLVTACSSPRMELPSGFLEIQAPGGEFKATNPDEARLWIRDFEDPDEGALDFWSETLTKDFTRNRGYVLEESFEVRTREGVPGRAHEFSARIDGEPHHYLIALFVIEGFSGTTIRVVEFSARDDVFDAAVGGIREKLTSVEG